MCPSSGRQHGTTCDHNAGDDNTGDDHTRDGRFDDFHDGRG